MVNARQRCASLIRGSKVYWTSCFCLFSSRAHSLTAISVEHLAPLLGQKPSQLTPGRITYDLRRLRLHGLIERIPKSYRYRITAKGLRTAIFYTRLYNRALRTGLAIIPQLAIDYELPIAKSIRAAEVAVNNWYDDEKLAA